MQDNLSELLWLGSAAFPTRRVLVPEPMLDDAHGLIESHFAEQEAAARSEAEPAPIWILARYQDGVFKPIDAVELEEGTEVEVRLPATGEQ